MSWEVEIKIFPKKEIDHRLRTKFSVVDYIPRRSVFFPMLSISTGRIGLTRNTKLISVTFYVIL